MDQGKTGRLIAALRREKSMTQRELAGKLGVTDRAISKWENGRGLPELDLLLPLCGALGCRVEELLAGEMTVGQHTEQAGDLRQEYERILAQRRRHRRLVKGFLTVIAAGCLMLIIILGGNRTFFRTSYQSEHCENVRIAIPRFCFYRSEGGLETHLVKLKTLKQPDGIEVFIDAYLSALELVEGESGIYYYNRSKDFTIWQYGVNNDGVGFINTIYIGYADGYYDGAI